MKFPLLVAVAVVVGVSSSQSMLAAPPPTASGLAVCAYSPSEIQSAFGIQVDKQERSDMALTAGRDVGCIYTIKDSSLVISVRQTWDNARSASSSPSMAF